MKQSKLENIAEGIELISSNTDHSSEEVIDILVGTVIDEETAFNLLGVLGIPR